MNLAHAAEELSQKPREHLTSLGDLWAQRGAHPEALHLYSKDPGLPHPHSAEY